MALLIRSGLIRPGLCSPKAQHILLLFSLLYHFLLLYPLFCSSIIYPLLYIYIYIIIIILYYRIPPLFPQGPSSYKHKQQKHNKE